MQLNIDTEFSFLFAGPSTTSYRFLAGYSFSPRIALFAGGGASRFNYQEGESEMTDKIEVTGEDYVLGGKILC